MMDLDRFLFELRNALTPLKASISLLARDWDSLDAAERRDLAVLAHDQMKVIDELLTRASAGRGGEEPD
jgi:hypothetical protein